MNILRIIASLVLTAFILTAARTAAASELSAGAARIDITPPLEYGSPLGGYGERMSRPAEGVHDRVFAKALILSDGQQKFTVIKGHSGHPENERCDELAVAAARAARE